MKFYNREKELEVLKKADSLKSQKSIMTMLIGRRRVGKTTLAKMLSLYYIQEIITPLLSELHQKTETQTLCNCKNF